MHISSSIPICVILRKPWIVVCTCTNLILAVSRSDRHLKEWIVHAKLTSENSFDSQNRPVGVSETMQFSLCRKNLTGRCVYIQRYIAIETIVCCNKGLRSCLLVFVNSLRQTWICKLEDPFTKYQGLKSPA